MTGGTASGFSYRRGTLFRGTRPGKWPDGAGGSGQRDRPAPPGMGGHLRGGRRRERGGRATRRWRMTVPIDKSPHIKFQRHPLDEVCINTIRTLSIDAIQAANSGHPGTPMAMAPVGYYLWQYVLRFDPQDPIWPNRDRFVLSAGHASMLLYALLHLAGVRAVSKDYERLGEPSVPLEAIKAFRQWHSRCA